MQFTVYQLNLHKASFKKKDKNNNLKGHLYILTFLGTLRQILYSYITEL